MKQIESELETLQEKLHKIKTWIDAYPLEVFPEPDFKKAHEVLKQHGMSLDAISASCDLERQDKPKSVPRGNRDHSKSRPAEGI